MTAPLEHTLRHSPLLTGLNVFRICVDRETAAGRILSVEAVVRLGVAEEHIWLAFRGYEYSRETPADRMMPAITRIGSGDGSQLRIEAWDWSARYALPRGLTFLLVGAPETLPEGWSSHVIRTAPSSQ